MPSRKTRLNRSPHDGPEDLTIRERDVVKVIRDDGRKEIRVVTADPWQLGHGAYVVGLEGISGGFALSRCRKLKFEPLTTAAA